MKYLFKILKPLSEYSVKNLSQCIGIDFAGKYLIYEDPLSLYNMAKRLKKRLIVLDLGSKASGIAIADPSLNKCFAVQLLDLEKNYELTFLERMLAHAYGKQPGGLVSPIRNSFNILVPLQLLKADTSDPSKNVVPAYTSAVLNELAVKHDAIGYICGYSSDSRYREKTENYSFIEAYTRKIDADRCLVRRFFSVVNEQNTSKIAKEHTLPAFYKELFDLGAFAEAYKSIRGMYSDTNVLLLELNKLLRGYTNCFAAVKSGEVFLDKCFNGKLKSNSQNRKGEKQMKIFVRNQGYLVDIPDLAALIVKGYARSLGYIVCEY